VRGLLGQQHQRRPQTVDTLAERMVLAMVNEAARCVEEGIVAGAEQVDLAMIFGAGFPPYRGGVLRHADTVGSRTSPTGWPRTTPRRARASSRVRCW
jgi:3-hydroxyacyl-CoA dehydrogenase